MHLHRMTTRGMLATVACAPVALGAYQALLRTEWAGSPVVGFAIALACVACVAAIAVRDALKRRRSKRGGEGTWKAVLKSLTVAVVLIGATDSVFVASYLLFSHGRWYVVPWVDDEPELNLPGVEKAALIAVGVAFLLRWAIWPNERAEGAMLRDDPEGSLGEDQSRVA